MSAARPFASDQELQATAKKIWNSLSQESWLEAFTAHPRIGNVESLRAKFKNTKGWAEDEQAGAAMASDKTIEDLALCNEEYFQKFGYLFIVCATGKSAAEMLEILRVRLSHDPTEELKIAAREQLQITLLRLNKLVD